jgi:archaellum component FlaC
MDEEFGHFDDRIRARHHTRDLERLLAMTLSKIMQDEGKAFGYRSELVSEKEKPFDPNEQILKLSSEVQELRNQVNKYMKAEAREESIGHLRQLASGINEIRQIYAQHKADSIVFSVFYDQGDRLAILEKIVDIEIELDKVFKTINFDFHVLPYSEPSTKMLSSFDKIYDRKETKAVNAQLHLA